MNKSEMIEKLDLAKRLSSAPRSARVVRDPVGAVWPVVLTRAMRKFGKSATKDIKTFWGGTFTGVLPEVVTTQIWRSSYFDEPVCRSLIQFLEPGGTFVDIGAHMGFFSLLASELVGPAGRVVSIEAMPSTYAHLRENIRRNAPYQNLALHQGAAFDKVTTLEFSDFGLVASSLNTAFTHRGQDRFITGVRKVAIEAAPADDILQKNGLQKVDLIKIDAESSEKFVIAGLEQTLTAHKPAIVMEVGDISSDAGTPTAELIDILSSRGYRAYEWKGRDLIPFSSVGPMPYANLVFQHEASVGG